MTLKAKDGGRSWLSMMADKVISAHPDEKIYTTAAGISPSGVVHFGNFRDVVISHQVRDELIKRGKNARLIFSWDNFDRLRKIPTGVPESFVEHIGKPLTKVPDPSGKLSSYAERFQKPFVEAMEKLDINIEYRDQTSLYESGTYDDKIFLALSKREEIARILLSFMSEKAKGEKGIDPESYCENYYPISVYSRFSGKDNTKVLEYDGDTSITYLCRDTGKKEEVDISKDHIVKLAWKIDWPMRWQYEGVIFEPAGHDHASPGGSFETASVISRDIFGYKPPSFVEYKFVGIQGDGSKMSGSKGNAVSPLELLDIYESEMLKWLYSRKSPGQSFELAFNTEIYRQYDEYDEENKVEAIPFRQAVGFGQVVQWQDDKLEELLDGLNLKYDKKSIKIRLPLAKNWLTKYNPDEAIVLNKEINTAYSETLSDERRDQVKKLREGLLEKKNPTVTDLETLVYGIPKSPDLDEDELKKEQKAFFKDIYNLLIGKDKGPRLATFLWASDRDKIIKLLDIK